MGDAEVLLYIWLKLKKFSFFCIMVYRRQNWTEKSQKSFSGRQENIKDVVWGMDRTGLGNLSLEQGRDCFAWTAV